MNKNVKIEKEIKFPSMIGEITAIQLEKEIKNIKSNSIEGKLMISGKYKKTSASQLEDEFNYDIPIDITITESLDPNTIDIKIKDFYYNIIENESIKCNIELEIDGIELLIDNRECDGDPIEDKEMEIPHVENNNIEEKIEKNEQKEEREEKESNPIEEENIFNLDKDNDSYGTFIVYIVRQNETINTIIEKYKTTLEELEKYNDIKEIGVGTKLIIPYINETNSK